MYGVPCSTLHDHCNGKSDVHCKSGRKPYLSMAEEEELVNFLDVHCRIGYPYTRKQVIAIIQEVVDGKGMKVQVTSGWWKSFVKRHPTITLRTAVKTGY